MPEGQWQRAPTGRCSEQRSNRQPARASHPNPDSMIGYLPFDVESLRTSRTITRRRLLVWPVAGQAGWGPRLGLSSWTAGHTPSGAHTGQILQCIRSGSDRTSVDTITLAIGGPTWALALLEGSRQLFMGLPGARYLAYLPPRRFLQEHDYRTCGVLRRQLLLFNRVR